MVGLGFAVVGIPGAGLWGLVVGAIGGFLSMGIIGLFVGSVVLVLFHTLFKSWLNEGLPVGAEVPASASGDRDRSGG